VQTLRQKLAQTLYQDQTKGVDENVNEKQNSQLLSIVGLLFEQNEETQVKLSSLKESVDEIQQKLELMHDSDVGIDERVDDVKEQVEQIADRVDVIYTRNYFKRTQNEGDDNEDNKDETHPQPRLNKRNGRERLIMNLPDIYR
jgi:hypothetical protein